MEAITGEHIPPQTWTDYEYGAGYGGYTGLQQAVDFIRKHYANPPPMGITNPDDTFAYVLAAGERGEPCAVLFHISNSVEIGPFNAGYHCSVPVAGDSQSMVVRNVWAPDWYQTLDRNRFNAACSGTNAGSLIHFGAQVMGATSGGDLTVSQADDIRREVGGALSRIAWHALYGHNVDGPDHANIAQACVDKGIDGGIMGWLDDPNNTALRDADNARQRLNSGGS